MATLTDAERTELETELAALKVARTAFLKGERANRMNVGDEGIGFADVPYEELVARIREIEDKLAADDPCSTTRRRPFTVRW